MSKNYCKLEDKELDVIAEEADLQGSLELEDVTAVADDEGLLRSNRAYIWVEVQKIWKITSAAMLSRVAAFGLSVVTQAFIGSMGKTELAAFSLVLNIGVRLLNGIITGMSSATETLCGQAYGAKQYHMLGIFLQRSWSINLATVTIFIPLFVFISPIFKLMGQENDIADLAGYISLLFIPVLYSMPFSYTIQNYLQSQTKNKVVAWLSTISFLVHIFLSWLFVRILNWGIPGAMGALIITNWLIVIGEFWYLFGGWIPDTWNGFTMAALLDLWPMLKLSVSSGVMICLERWYTAILVLIAGYMPDASVAISAFSICINILVWEFTICLGFLIGASVRVSNELGRRDAKAAKFSIQVIVSMSAIMGVVFCILCLVFGHQFGYLFTKDKQVVEVVGSLSVLLAFSILLNSLQPVLSGVAVGSGRQGIVALVNIGCYYVIGVPIGIVLGYVGNLQVRGVWIGMIIGVALQTAVLSYITWKTNWEDEVKKASERLDKWLTKEAEDGSISNTNIGSRRDDP